MLRLDQRELDFFPHQAQAHKADWVKKSQVPCADQWCKTQFHRAFPTPCRSHLQYHPDAFLPDWLLSKNLCNRCLERSKSPCFLPCRRYEANNLLRHYDCHPWSTRPEETRCDATTPVEEKKGNNFDPFCHPNHASGACETHLHWGERVHNVPSQSDQHPAALLGQSMSRTLTFHCT